MTAILECCLYVVLAFKGGLSPSKKVNFTCFNGSTLKVMKSAFYFMLKAIFVLDIFTFLSSLFGYVEKRLDQKAKVNFRIHDATDLTASNYNTYLDQYFKK